MVLSPGCASHFQVMEDSYTGNSREHIVLICPPDAYVDVPAGSRFPSTAMTNEVISPLNSTSDGLNASDSVRIPDSDRDTTQIHGLTRCTSRGILPATLRCLGGFQTQVT